MRTAALLFVAPAVHAFVAPSANAPLARLAPLNVAPITVAALDDAVTAKVISAELQEMLDREWIEQDCHVVIGQNAADAYLGARAKGLDDVGSILQHVGEQMTTDFPVDAYVGPWDCANFVSDTLVALASGERCECSSAPPAAELAARAAEFGESS